LSANHNGNAIRGLATDIVSTPVSISYTSTYYPTTGSPESVRVAASLSVEAKGYSDFYGAVSLSDFPAPNPTGSHPLKIYEYTSAGLVLTGSSVAVEFCSASHLFLRNYDVGGGAIFIVRKQTVDLILDNPNGAYCVEDITTPVGSATSSSYRNGNSVQPIIHTPNFSLAASYSFDRLPSLASYPTPICGRAGTRAAFCNPLP
jgi:hypothetical protein